MNKYFQKYVHLELQDSYCMFLFKKLIEKTNVQKKFKEYYKTIIIWYITEHFK